MRSSPLAVVGTPGSGTRVFARLAEAAGRDMGAGQTEANDAFALYRFASKWCKRVYPAWARGEEIDYAEFESDLEPHMAAHRSQSDPAAPWGWKQPRSLYMLPGWNAVFPDLLVIHVIRDGRDIPFGSQPNVELSGRYTLPDSAEGQPEEVQAAMVWDGPNRLAADFGEAVLGERYLRLSLEEVCADPEATVERLVDHLEGDPIEPERLHSIVLTPTTLGRWRDEDPELVERIASAAAAGLRRFGYA